MKNLVSALKIRFVKRSILVQALDGTGLAWAGDDEDDYDGGNDDYDNYDYDDDDDDDDDDFSRKRREWPGLRQ